jgi:hypothetical protein
MLRESSVRDVIDYLEYDIDPDRWITRLVRQIEAGTYEPQVPIRFLAAKTNGFVRTMTMPSIPDLTLYRAVVDGFYRRLRRYEVKHAYFERATLEAAQRKAASEARQEMEPDPHYPATARQRYLAWLKFDEYRRHLILDRVYDFVITADISNYFDTILHSRLAESLHRAGADPSTVGLLFFLIERLSIRREHTESPRIGLPVDQFDCSRKLAHLLLFATIGVLLPLLVKMLMSGGWTIRPLGWKAALPASVPYVSSRHLWLAYISRQMYRSARFSHCVRLNVTFI